MPMVSERSARAASTNRPRPGLFRVLAALAVAVLVVPLAGCPKDGENSGPKFLGITSITGLENTKKKSSNLYTANLRIDGTAVSFDVEFQSLKSGQTIDLTVDRYAGMSLTDAGITGLPDISAGTQPADYDEPGGSISTVIVNLLDEFDAITTNATNQVTVALGDSPDDGCELTGTLTQTPVNGQATFADLDIDLTAVGDFTLIFTASGLTSDESDTFTVSAIGPIIFSVSPRIMRDGIQITITGTGFNATASNNTVDFEGDAGTVDSGDDTELLVTVPTDVTAGDLTVTDTIAVQTSDDFAYIVGPFTANLDEDDNEVSGGASDYPSLSENGRYVAFESDATDLVDDDTNGRTDIFVRDNWTSEIWRVSVQSDGDQATGGDSTRPSISDDGMRIVFQSTATNLVSGDSNGLSDIFLHDRDTGETTRISESDDGDEANRDCTNPAISGDGLFAAFQSSSTTLVDGKSFNGTDIFFRDIDSETLIAVSVNQSDALVSGNCTFPHVSNDGQYVSFSATASLAANDSNASIDIYVRDTVNETTTLASLNDADNDLSSGLETGAVEARSAVSDDGMRVLFISQSADLSGPAGVLQIWLRDSDDDSTTLISRVTGGGVGGNDTSRFPRLSGDGLFAVFASDATNLVSGAGTADIYHYDIDNQVTTRVNVNAAGSVANGDCLHPAISPGGREFAFASDGNNLVDTDTNGLRDIFVSSN